MVAPLSARVDLTAEQIDDACKYILGITRTQLNHYIRAYIKDWLRLLAPFGFIASIICFFLFFFSALFHEEPWQKVITIGLYGILSALGGVVLFLMAGVIRVCLGGGEFAREALVRKDLRENKAEKISFKVKEAYTVVDQGIEEYAHHLLRAKNDSWLCVPNEPGSPVLQAFCPRESVEILLLPKSRVLLSLQSEGVNVPITKKIYTDNIWRNDDLPFFEFFQKGDMPNELLTKLEAA